MFISVIIIVSVYIFADIITFWCFKCLKQSSYDNQTRLFYYTIIIEMLSWQKQFGVFKCLIVSTVSKFLFTVSTVSLATTRIITTDMSYHWPLLAWCLPNILLLRIFLMPEGTRFSVILCAKCFCFRILWN